MENLPQNIREYTDIFYSVANQGRQFRQLLWLWYIVYSVQAFIWHHQAKSRSLDVRKEEWACGAEAVCSPRESLLA